MLFPRGERPLPRRNRESPPVLHSSLSFLFHMVPVNCFNRKCSYYSRFVLHLCFGQHYRLRFSYCVLRGISPAVSCPAFRQPRFVGLVLRCISPAAARPAFRRLRLTGHFVGCVLRHASFIARRAAFCQLNRLPLTAFRAKNCSSSYLLVFLSSRLAFLLLVFLFSCLLFTLFLSFAPSLFSSRPFLCVTLSQ